MGSRPQARRTSARGLGTALSVALMGAIFAALESARALGAPDNAAFASAFQDTYRIAALARAAALGVSLALWRRAG